MIQMFEFINKISKVVLFFQDGGGPDGGGAPSGGESGACAPACVSPPVAPSGVGDPPCGGGGGGDPPCPLLDCEDVGPFPFPLAPGDAFPLSFLMVLFNLRI
jgi:hypothetical protein